MARPVPFARVWLVVFARVCFCSFFVCVFISTKSVTEVRYAAFLPKLDSLTWKMFVWRPFCLWYKCSLSIFHFFTILYVLIYAKIPRLQSFKGSKFQRFKISKILNPIFNTQFPFHVFFFRNILISYSRFSRTAISCFFEILIPFASFSRIY